MGSFDKRLWIERLLGVKLEPFVRPEDEAAALRAKEAADHKAWLRANAESVTVPEPSREIVEALYQLGRTLETAEQRERLRVVLRLVHGKPGDRVLAELLAEERERGREEAELAASRKAAEGT